MPRTYPGLLQGMKLRYDSGAVAILYSEPSLVTGLTFDDTDVSGENITITAHGLSNFFEVQLTPGSGALPSPLSSSSTYIVDVVDVNTIRLSDSVEDKRNSVFISLTPVGGETGHGVDESGVSIESGIEYVALKETGNINGYARVALATPTYTVDTDTNQNVTTANIVANFTASGGNIAHDGIAVLIGASTTYGSTTGECDSVLPIGGPILDGVSQDFNIRISDARAPFNTVGTG